ncbi:hypothetical protein ColTof4_05612 [Colletotrichum tofieldiae]|nr:hypothetical protein ColTof3_00771 [Colletotrichum tofieldiae]GKT73189.1 hypothetical protein ColTof4_05612 [Colletotrichum tofieldiae]
MVMGPRKDDDGIARTKVIRVLDLLCADQRPTIDDPAFVIRHPAPIIRFVSNVSFSAKSPPAAAMSK